MVTWCHQKEEDNTMKVKDIAKHMNNYGTNPRIEVHENNHDYFRIIYEGSPYNVSEEIAAKKINSFTVRGVGFIEIYV